MLILYQWAWWCNGYDVIVAVCQQFLWLFNYKFVITNKQISIVVSHNDTNYDQCFARGNPNSVAVSLISGMQQICTVSHMLNIQSVWELNDTWMDSNCCSLVGVLCHIPQSYKGWGWRNHIRRVSIWRITQHGTIICCRKDYLLRTHNVLAISLDSYFKFHCVIDYILNILFYFWDHSYIKRVSWFQTLYIIMDRNYIIWSFISNNKWTTATKYIWIKC